MSINFLFINRDMFDFSKYSKNSEFYNETNQKVTG